jgi:biotin carboxyl carrier protein
MMLTKIKWTTAALLVAALLTFGTLSLTGPRADASPTAEKPQVEKPSVEKPPAAAPGGTEETAKSRDLVAVPAPREGVIAFIGRPVRDGEKPKQRAFPVLVGGKPRAYTRLQEGDRVEKGELLLRLNDELARAEVDIKLAKVTAAEADLRAAEATAQEANRRYEALREALRRIPGSVSEDELAGVRLTSVRYAEEVKSKMAAIVVLKKEVELVNIVLRMYEIRAPVSGTIKAVLKNTGEGVRQLEAVVHIQPDDK